MKTRRIKGAEEIRERRFLAPGRNIILFYGAFRFSLRLLELLKSKDQIFATLATTVSRVDG